MRFLKYLGLAMRLLPVIEVFLEGLSNIFDKEKDNNEKEMEKEKVYP